MAPSSFNNSFLRLGRRFIYCRGSALGTRFEQGCRNKPPTTRLSTYRCFLIGNLFKLLGREARERQRGRETVLMLRRSVLALARQSTQQRLLSTMASQTPMEDTMRQKVSLLLPLPQSSSPSPPHSAYSSQPHLTQLTTISRYPPPSPPHI
jgi:hypothetical protein